MLRILAHELRSPGGVAQGYLRMALDGRLPDPADHRRALEQTLQAVERMSALGREASEVATWLERSSMSVQRSASVSLRALLDSLLQRSDSNLDASLGALDDSALVFTSDEAALTRALTSLIGAVVRESPRTRLTMTATSLSKATAVEPSAHASNDHVDLVVGAPHVIPELQSGPTAPNAGPLSLERGGLGLSLVMAVLVLDAHGATIWTINDQRAALGVRFLVRTGQHT